MTRILKIDPSLPMCEGSNDLHLRIAADALSQGELVAFPTETVYGFGANPEIPASVEHLIRVKKRPPNKPFTRLLRDLDVAQKYLRSASGIAIKLARCAWPGPLTMVVPSVHHSGQWQGIRVSSSPIVHRLLELTPGGAMVAPSANRSGEPDSLQVSDFLDDAVGEISVILDAGPILRSDTPPAPGIRPGRPSTVVKIDGPSVEVLRDGAFPPRALQSAARRVIFVVVSSPEFSESFSKDGDRTATSGIFPLDAIVQSLQGLIATLRDKRKMDRSGASRLDPEIEVVGVQFKPDSSEYIIDSFNRDWLLPFSSASNYPFVLADRIIPLSPSSLSRLAEFRLYRDPRVTIPDEFPLSDDFPQELDSKSEEMIRKTLEEFF